MHDSHNHLTLVRIRLCQLRRHIAGWGPWYTAATFLTICLATLVVFLQYRSFIPGLVCTSAVLLVVLFVHTHRSDINFVVHTMERPSLNFLAEYFFFTFPFSGPALLTRQWYFFPITVTGGSGSRTRRSSYHLISCRLSPIFATRSICFKAVFSRKCMIRQVLTRLRQTCSPALT